MPSSSSKRAVAAATAAAALALQGAVPASAKGIVRGMDLCTSFSRVCVDITSQVDCRSHFDGMVPKPLVDVEGCKHSQSYDTFVGACKCGGMEAGPTVLQELVDYSITDAMPAILAANKAGENATDFGAAYVKACTTFLGGSKCPAELQHVKGYGATAASHWVKFAGDCSCGTIDVGDRVRDSVAGFMVSRKLATTAVVVQDPATNATTGVDLCQSFGNACGALLDEMGCPAAIRGNPGCTVAADPTTLAGTCTCGAVDASQAVKQELVRFAVRAELETGKVYADDLATSLEFCGTYENVCTAFLTKAGVPADAQDSAPNCMGGKGTNLATFKATCAAGAFDVSAALQGLLVGKSVEGDVAELVCLGDECSPYALTPGLMAVIIISGVLAFVGLLTFAYQRGDAWAHAIMSNPLINRLVYPITCLFRSRAQRAKHSPEVTTQEIHLRGMA